MRRRKSDNPTFLALPVPARAYVGAVVVEHLGEPGGVLIVGSASTPFVYKVRSGSTTAEKFVDASAEGPGTFFFGMLADASTNTLWTCQLTRGRA